MEEGRTNKIITIEKLTRREVMDKYNIRQNNKYQIFSDYDELYSVLGYNRNDRLDKK